MPTLEPATDLDPNVWYQISELAVDTADKDLHGMLQPTAPGGDLRVWPANKNSYWQFQKIDDKPGRYQLRCSDTTVKKQLSVCYRPDVINEKRRTRPCLMATDDTDKQKWDVSLWGKDDTYRITNVQNGTKWNLDCIPDGPVFMSSNFEGEQLRQQWLLQSVGEVNNDMYSTTYSAPPTGSTGDSTATTAGTTAGTTGSNSEATATSDPPSNESSDKDSSSSSDNNGNNGLSSGAVAGISVAITLAVVALALAGFFFWRRNKRKHSPIASSDPSDDKYNNSPIVVSPGDGTHSHYAPDKMPDAAEMSQEQRPAELPNGYQRHEMA
ncbi:hypothetical protein FPOA_05644 [Fusarium poae]|uniref:Ricin B lectin domain-containing protein n=1 Tax=Fusarium poae TaxID=36050 RepID=A0A1B8AX46_FUSPO|nr:hypothetical protein FPOA_05644 [Fusarium poae]